MKIATYFMKVCGASLIALSGFVMFIHGIASSYTTASNAFWGLAVMSAGIVLLAYVLESSTCPVKLSVDKKEANKAPADTAAAPATQDGSAENHEQ